MSATADFFRQQLLGLARFIHKNATAIVFGAVVLTLASLIYTWINFKVVNNISDLLDENSPENKAYLAYKKEFGVDEEYVIMLRSGDAALNRRVADDLAPRLQAIQPGIRKVFYKLDFSRLEKRFLLFQSEDELRQIERDVTGYAKAMRQNSIRLDLNSMLDQANRSFDDKYLRKASNWKEFKPFVDKFAEMLNQLAEKIEDGKRPAKTAAKTASLKKGGRELSAADLERIIAEHEYPASFDEGRMLLVMATPGKREKDSASPYSGTLKKIREVIADMEKKYPEVKFGLTGEPVLNDDEMHTASRDMTLASFITLALIVAIFGASYRRWSRPAWAVMVLLMAVSWCFAYAMISVGHLNIISQAFVPMMLGLGIDFGIQMMGRYEEERGRGRSIAESLESTLPHTGLAIITGGCTTAAAFYTMCFNDFVGLRELGAICGGSVLLCLAANLIVLPAVYVWRDSRETATGKEHHDAVFLVGPQLNDWWVRRPKTVLSVAALLTLLAAAGIPRIWFDYNLLHLQNPKIESVNTLHMLFREAGSSIIYGSITCDTLDEARAKKEALLKLSSVKEVNSILDVMPERQEEKLGIVRKIVSALQGIKLDTDVSKQVDVIKARQNIALLLDQSRKGKKQAQNYVHIAKMARDAVETFGKLIPPLERALEAMKGLSQEELGKRLNRYQVDVFGSMQKGLAWLKMQQTDRGIVTEDIPESLRDRFIGKTGKYLLQVYPKEDIWEREPLERFVKEVRSVDPDFTGTPTQNYAYIDLLRKSYVQAAGWAFVAIVVLIGIHFRSVLYTGLAILPLILAVIWTLGIMGWFNIAFNPANIMTLPMVIGIGVAFGVYTVERFQEEKRMNLFIGSTGKAVILSTLTAISGFASMLVSQYNGLFSLGLVMTIGITMCLISSMGLLPQVFKLLEKKHGNEQHS
jgi:hopanoid biosynthesis associated RND transporter like protein HpnN